MIGDFLGTIPMRKARSFPTMRKCPGIRVETGTIDSSLLAAD